jgi:hypothetical protein
MPEPGEVWREWELPWMWLLVAKQGGVVRAGSGFGLWPGGSLDYRTNASDAEGMKGGANILLAWEAMRRGRDAGHRWVNWGGATRFKLDLGGECLTVHSWLGGGPLWQVPNRLEVAWEGLQERGANWLRARRRKEAAESKPESAERPATPR